MVALLDALRVRLAQQEKSTAALTERVQRYRELLRATRAYSYSVALEDGKPVSTEHEPGCVAVTGYAPQDYASDPLLWISMVHADDREDVRAHAAALLAGRSPGPIEHRIVRRDGRVRWVRNTVVPHHDAEGRLRRYDGLVADITEQKQAEQALQEGERLNAIGSLAGGVAHRFNALTEMIAGSASSLAGELVPGTHAHQESHRILDAARHAGHLTQRLMSVARMCEPGEAAQLEVVSVRQVVRDTIEMLEPALDARNMRIAFLDSEAPLFARCVSSQLVDALMNLLLNAAEAMPDGGTITVDVSRRGVKPRAPAFGGEGARAMYGVIRVRDSGPGMSREALDRVFDPLSATRRSRSAFGLGLTVVKSIVQRWGGGVSVWSREGVGASFRLLLPEASAAQARDAQASVAGGHVVLLVDDDLAWLDALKATFERAGYSVCIADTLEKAVAASRREGRRVALSVVDLIMPAAGCRELVEAIFEKDPDARVIVTSGFSRDFVRGILPHGAWGFVQKPFEEDRLLRLVNDMVSTGRQGLLPGEDANGPLDG